MSAETESLAELLKEVLRLARAEGALEGEGLEAFAAALAERADLILAERVRALEAENAWRRESMAGLEESLAAAQAQGLEASQAHDRLLAHHRDVLGRTVAELEALVRLPAHQWLERRRRLRDLAESLEGELR